jgi:hypothetical protein
MKKITRHLVNRSSGQDLGFGVFEFKSFLSFSALEPGTQNLKKPVDIYEDFRTMSFVRNGG